VGGDYELASGEVIAQTFMNARLDPLHHPGVLVASHGPFAWGADLEEAVMNAVAVEVIARIAYQTLAISGETGPIEPYLLDRHFERKHGPNAYYGQPLPPGS
jgi:L-ribulose-5-phosphate 4-epimerase